MTTAITPATPLWALAPEYAAVFAEVMEAEGDISDEDLAARLDAITGAFGDKVEKCQLVFRHMTGDAAACKAFAEAVAKPYQERAARLEAMAERMKKYVYAAMVAAKLDRVETPLGGARIQGNGGVLPVLFDGDAAKLPAEFQRVTYELDRGKVLAAHAAKQSLPEGVKVGERGRSLRWI